MMSVGRAIPQVPQRALSQALRSIRIREIVHLALGSCYLSLEFSHFVVDLLQPEPHIVELILEFNAIHHTLHTVFDLCNFPVDFLQLPL